eukprot:CAMPEP_0197078998 /NCGR_PEP_ID=MMETSP1384-20130603/213404_1 /TAXON_ID=29189 /ORGANISM="Ammonia sp." /LENGTH=63 /DNA_ID=CAMNT_0042517867 /DNA_START=154 /DNA_END=345 /DNA_ORIENTATION=-
MIKIDAMSFMLLNQDEFQDSDECENEKAKENERKFFGFALIIICVIMRSASHVIMISTSQQFP